MTEEDHFNKYGRQLAVHHLRSVRTFHQESSGEPDYEEMNALSNLLTLCINCHRSREANSDTK